MRPENKQNKNDQVRHDQPPRFGPFSKFSLKDDYPENTNLMIAPGLRSFVVSPPEGPEVAP